jgi:RimJ/RimL family protein N-acetyltransferase
VNFPLLTERLSIQPLAIEDLKDFVRYRQDPEVARYQSWDSSYSLKQGLDLVESQAGMSWPGYDEWLQLAVRTLETPMLVGDLALHKFPEPNQYEIGFTFAREHQGQGFATESAARLIGFLFDECFAEVVIATPDSRNGKSINLLQRLGFIQNPAKTWVEQFKGESVRVEFFELKRNQVVN